MKLDEILPKRNFKTVIFTDRYPPNSVGGAEVSLHIMLSKAEEKSGFLVVTFNDDIDEADFYETEGISVLQLPGITSWPYHDLTVAAYKDQNTEPSAPKRHFKKILHLLKYAVKSGPFHMVERFLMLYVNFFRLPRGGVVNDYERVQSGLRIKMISAILEYVQPETVHADNFRSIITIASLREKTDAKLIGLVRDNRFACVSFDQSMMVNGKTCNTCELGCAQAGRLVLKLHKKWLAKSQNFRQDSLRKLDKVIVTSDFLEKQISQILPADKIRKISNSADDVSKVQSYLTGICEMPGTNILVIGMLNENKGQLEFIKYLEDLVVKIPGVKIYFAGRGVETQIEMEALLEKQKLGHHVVFLDYQDRTSIYQWIRRCQIVALPTMWPEPFGRVPLEAGMASRPVVAFSMGGLQESIKDGKTGYLIEDKSMTDFNTKLAELANNPTLRREIGQANFQHVLANYNVENRFEELKKVWSEA